MGEENVSDGDLRHRMKGIALGSHGEREGNTRAKQMRDFCFSCSDKVECIHKISRSSESSKSTSGENNSDSSFEDPLCAFRFSPKDVINAFGQREFWVARKAILRQQEVFSLQVFDLHRLIKVQQLMASSQDTEVDAVKDITSKNVPREVRYAEEANGFIEAFFGMPKYGERDFVATISTKSCLEGHQGQAKTSPMGFEASWLVSQDNICIPMVPRVENGGHYHSTFVPFQDETFSIQNHNQQSLDCSKRDKLFLGDIQDLKLRKMGTLWYEAGSPPVGMEQLEIQGCSYQTGVNVASCQEANAIESERRTLILFPLGPSLDLCSKKTDEHAFSGGDEHCTLIKATPQTALSAAESAAVILSSIQRERQQSLSVK